MPKHRSSRETYVQSRSQSNFASLWSKRMTDEGRSFIDLWPPTVKGRVGKVCSLAIRYLKTTLTVTVKWVLWMRKSVPGRLPLVVRYDPIKWRTTDGRWMSCGTLNVKEELLLHCVFAGWSSSVKLLLEHSPSPSGRLRPRTFGDFSVTKSKNTHFLEIRLGNSQNFPKTPF